MNAILQCIVHTPLLKPYFTSGLFKQHISKKHASSSSDSLLADIVSEFLKEYGKVNDPIVSLRKIKNVIGKYLPQFQGYDQHDAQEFLAMILDRLTEELTTTVKVPINNVPSFSKTMPNMDVINSPDKAQDNENKQDASMTPTKSNTQPTEIEKKISVMSDLFCGELCTTITCPNCGNVSDLKETFYYLSVPLPLEVFFDLFKKNIGYLCKIYVYEKVYRD